jgi:hypothetical protein
MGLPNYVSDRGHGEIAYAAPLMICEATAYAFVFKANCSQVQAFVDEQLNAVSGGAVHYTALPMVIQIWVNVKRATSLAENIGWLPDRESMFWVPLVQTVSGTLSPMVWVPYLFIDIDSGMVTGREVWGFRKTLASIDVPENPFEASSLVARTTIFPEFNREKEGLRHAELVRTTCLDGAARAVESEWSSFDDAAAGIAAALENAGLDPGIYAQELRASLISRTVHAVNLKQYRDAEDSSKACYQALVDSGFKLERWRGGGPLLSQFELAITPCESHQIASDLGLGPTWKTPVVVRPKCAFWWKMDFLAQPGKVVWSAT